MLEGDGESPYSSQVSPHQNPSMWLTRLSPKAMILNLPNATIL